MSDERSAAEAMAALMNAVAALAAPLVHRRALATTTPGALFADVEVHVDAFLRTLGSASIYGNDREVDSAALAQATEELRDLLRAHATAATIDPEVVAQARAWFATIGFGEPPGGWDAFTGEP